MAKLVTTPEGNAIELYEPPYSNVGAMRDGHCPGCGTQTRGYEGRCAAVREVAPSGVVVKGSNYGHYECVSKLYDDLVASAVELRVPDAVPNELRWTEGNQREFLDFLFDHPDEVVVCDFDYARHKSRRYRWRLEDYL